jgi:aminoglycoside phosphotransferase (APT) family kinase protein
MVAPVRDLDGDARAESAARAHRAASGDDGRVVERLKPRPGSKLDGPGKSRVYRIERGDGTTVVVKRCPAGAGRVERAALRALASAGSVSVPRLLGVAEDPDPTMIWHVLEDVGDCLPDLARATERRAALAFLASLHDADPGGGEEVLPVRDIEYYLALAAEARENIDATPATHRDPELDSILAATASMLRRLTDDLVCGSPAAFVHGDATVKNMRVRPDGTVVLFDWEHAGVGSIGVDLCNLVRDDDDVSTYLGLRNGVVTAEELRGAVAVGFRCRYIAAVNWATFGLARPTEVESTKGLLRGYAELTAAGLPDR